MVRSAGEAGLGHVRAPPRAADRQRGAGQGTGLGRDDPPPDRARTSPDLVDLDEPFIYHAARHYHARHGLRVPEDVSLVCTDGHPTFVWCRPSVAHIRWDERPVFRRIVRWANNIARGKDDRRQTDTKAEFVDGGTVGPVPKR